MCASFSIEIALESDAKGYGQRTEFGTVERLFVAAGSKESDRKAGRQIASRHCHHRAIDLRVREIQIRALKLPPASIQAKFIPVKLAPDTVADIREKFSCCVGGRAVQTFRLYKPRESRTIEQVIQQSLCFSPSRPIEPTGPMWRWRRVSMARTAGSPAASARQRRRARGAGSPRPRWPG